MNLTATRRALHALAELVLAGPQYSTSGTIQLRITPGGFATTTTPDVRVDGTDLVTGEQRLPIAGHSSRDLAAAIGVEPTPLGHLYGDVTDVKPDEILDVDPAAAAWLVRCWSAGDAALRRLAPTETPVLWPEHFDVGIRVDDTNYGISPGENHVPEPYAYVGPPTPQDGPFWNQPFGAARPMRDLDDADPDSVLAFFTDARHRINASLDARRTEDG